MTPLPFTDYSHFPILLGKTVYRGFKQKPVILAATPLRSVMNGFMVWHALRGSASLPFLLLHVSTLHAYFVFSNLYFKGLVHLKIKNVSSITHPHVVSNPLDFGSSSKTNEDIQVKSERLKVHTTAIFVAT